MSDRRQKWGELRRAVAGELSLSGWGTPELEVDSDGAILRAEHPRGFVLLIVVLEQDGETAQHAQLIRAGKVDRAWSWGGSVDRWEAVLLAIATRVRALLAPPEVLFELVPVRATVSWTMPAGARNHADTRARNGGAVSSDERGGALRRARDGR